MDRHPRTTPTITEPAHFTRNSHSDQANGPSHGAHVRAEVRVQEVIGADVSRVAAKSPSIGWYVHLPFCATKCGYCDFYSLPTIPALVDDLIRALETELELRDPARDVESVFVGGGTPTVLPADALGRLLTTISERAGPVLEFAVEANPSSTDELKLNLLREWGVNRISFGAQSFNRDELTVLERIHDPSHIPASVHAARAVGFENVNIDLIFGIPGQTIASWRDSLQRAIDLGTDHLSCYSLMYEDGTALTRLKREGRIIPCDEDLEAEMFEMTAEALTAAGFDQYEISNYAKPGKRCRANLIYWENREYLGIGPSAVSYLDGVRRKNVPDVRRYIEGMQSNPGQIVVEQEQLEPTARAGETAIQMLRLTDGIDVSRFRQQTGFDVKQLFKEAVARLARDGLIEEREDRVRLTRRGLLVANRVMQEFLPDTTVPAAGVTAP